VLVDINASGDLDEEGGAFTVTQGDTAVAA
jgi:hypothetical protein